jgi:hypothetical protein
MSRTRLPELRSIGQALAVATLAAAAIFLVEVLVFAESTDLSILLRGATIGVAIGYIALVTNGFPVPPGFTVGFGVVALMVYAWGLATAPPQGAGWIPFLLAAALPVGFIAWGVAQRRTRRGGHVA